MTFTIFKKIGEVHFDHNGFDDHDGDSGYPVDIEVDDERVHDDVLTMIYEDYFEKSVSAFCKVGFYSTSRNKNNGGIHITANQRGVSDRGNAADVAHA